MYAGERDGGGSHIQFSTACHCHRTDVEVIIKYVLLGLVATLGRHGNPAALRPLHTVPTQHVAIVSRPLSDHVRPFTLTAHSQDLVCPESLGCRAPESAQCERGVIHLVTHQDTCSHTLPGTPLTSASAWGSCLCGLRCGESE